MKLVKYLKSNAYLIGFGVLLTFLSSFGQTFVISLYLPSFQEYFYLSDGEFSLVYSGATLLSAFSITWLGRFIDQIRLTKFTKAVMFGLIVFLIILAFSYHVAILFVGLYGMRLFGQGLLSHTSITSMARFFEKGRGKAISFASLGHSIGEAFLPIIIVGGIFYVGWRYSLLLSAVFVLICIPFAIYLLRKNSNFTQLRKYIPKPFTKEESISASPKSILKTKAFWIIMPSSLAAAAIGTGFLLFKLKLGLAKDWSPAFVAGGFTAYAVGNALSNLLAGFLADRFSGKNLFPLYLIPGSIGIASLLLSSETWVYIVLIGGIGITNGFGSTIKNVALAEIYGERIIGSVRSLFTMIMVFSTAIGPLFFGFMLDSGYQFTDIALISIGIYLLMTFNASRIFKLKVSSVN
ncbi:MFS transporter [Psychroflexus planctonicus]|uniref:MFS transporter n=1 Tax=Psychroflexus planctonicus TaxID=1526575 RepID=A0ABQ1SJZ3_9FLAO|nr:MFS transporter [Psychroflexus planctonicus]GGE43656.1 MFS transporter [Psychroflexus planctonicus]